jgi:hypothetical protein
MKITINKDDFISNLKKISPGVSIKDLIKEYGCVYLSEKTISSFSERIIVSYPMSLIGFDCLVDYNTLLSMLEKLNSINIDLIKTEKELILKTNNLEYGIAIVEGEHPSIELPKKWQNLPEGFMDGLEFCSFSISKDMTIPSATCIHIHGNSILSTDTKRVTQYEMKEASPFDFHVPYVVMKNLKGYNFVKMAKGKNLIHFLEDNGAIFSFYQMSLDREISPETAKKFFAVEGTEIEFPKNFKKVIDRAAVTTEGLIELDLVVDITLENNKFEVSSKKESAWFREHGEINYNGKKVSIRVSAPFLSAILDRTNKCVIGKMCLFSGDKFKHVMVTCN